MMKTDVLNKKLKFFESQCHQAGLKITPQRTAIYRSLICNDNHPTAEDVYREVRREMPNVSLDTVNRTLLTLSHIGAAFIVEGTGQPRRFDGGLDNHQHLRCIQCGKVVDFHYEPLDNIALPEDIERTFRILRKTVYIEGLCETCQTETSTQYYD